MRGRVSVVFGFLHTKPCLDFNWKAPDGECLPEPLPVPGVGKKKRNNVILERHCLLACCKTPPGSPKFSRQTISVAFPFPNTLFHANIFFMLVSHNPDT